MVPVIFEWYGDNERKGSEEHTFATAMPIAPMLGDRVFLGDDSIPSMHVIRRNWVYDSSDKSWHMEVVLRVG